MLSVLPKRRGQVISVTSSPESHHFFIKYVLFINHPSPSNSYPTVLHCMCIAIIFFIIIYCIQLHKGITIISQIVAECKNICCNCLIQVVGTGGSSHTITATLTHSLSNSGKLHGFLIMSTTSVKFR